MARNNSSRNTKASTYQPYSTIPIQLPYNSAWGLVNLATDVTGVLAVEHGGTGVALTAGTIPMTWIGSSWDVPNLGYSYYYGDTGNAVTNASGNVSVGQNSLKSLLALLTNPPSVTITDSVSLASGTYTYRDVQNGKAHYNLNGFGTSNTVWSLIWTGAAWIVTDNLAATVYTSASAVPYPWQATGWTGTTLPIVLAATRSENNLAMGEDALRVTTSSARCVALGTGALQNNTADSNFAIGYMALNAVTSSTPNLAIGDRALMNTTNSDNVAIGFQAMLMNTTGNRNVAIGPNTLRNGTFGSGNVGIGFESLKSNRTGGQNMAIGDQTLTSNTTGVSNAAIGGQAMRDNSTGSDNLAFGFAALQRNQTGGSNTAYGSSALIQNIQGSDNVGIGREALQGTQYTNQNVGIGRNALRVMATGSAGATVATAHVAIGYQAGIAVSTGTNTVLIGHAVAPNLTTGSNNTIIGKSSGAGITTGANNTIIGANVTGLSNPSNNIVIADGAGNQRIVGNSTGQILIPYKATSTSTSTSLTFTSTNYGQKVYWSPTGTATGTLPANGAAVGSWFEVILLTDQDSTIGTVGLTGTMTTGTTTAAKSVGFVTAGQRIGSCVRFESNGSVWIAINLGSTAMTVIT